MAADPLRDAFFMEQAIALAECAAQHDEVPVGALVVRDGAILGQGWNCPIATHDPTAHAEVQALREAGQRIGNYRLPGCDLYVTLEPCPMCAGAIVHARLRRVIFGATDPKAGACGSVFNLLPTDSRFNHHTACTGGVAAERCSAQLKAFFRARR
ncbi:tRNA adenosine(34) deaminase TadA [Halochromatium glycolicum]